ncbi:MAG: selenide, water dikinase SelD, partial [Gemmatimonadetes bacterium]|nr:selenide, water dikinase SelD [Gemmatimonadota bacterium]NIS00244.1 selenide, water dikinase SelD [Gemmatimonadota bacterium]NIT68189.1 selenide, water dikinase SelD [Gemmatimonadota bacterium]NIU51493.1 selenide, water dikinase SelD [Gemmatimonadota bacterium]NIV24822.1 selenide, water dikinase SelD [Gemmatimonadota bacterium]
PPDAEGAAVDSMLRINAAALERVRAHDPRAVTDVTGFGLLGHLHDMAKMSGLGATVESASVPLLVGARELAAAGCVPGGTRRNLEFVEPFVRWPGDLDETGR